MNGDWLNGQVCGSEKNDGFLHKTTTAFRRWIADRHIKILTTVQHREQQRELGYVVDFPDFILRWDELSPRRRKKRLLRYKQLIREAGVQIVCVPYFYGMLPGEVVELLGDQVFLCYGNNLRFLTLIDSIKHLIGILKNRLSGMEAGIWCADTDMGRLMARMLMPSINFMTLGGHTAGRLFRLSDEIMNETGLACPVTTDLEECLKKKQFVVLTQRCDVSLLKNASIVVYTGPIDLEYMEEIRSLRGPFWILSGWTELPEDLEAGAKLSPWETIGVLESVLGLYEKDLSAEKGLEDNFGEIKVQGFISVDGEVSYDRFRMRYFAGSRPAKNTYLRKIQNK